MMTFEVIDESISIDSFMTHPLISIGVLRCGRIPATPICLAIIVPFIILLNLAEPACIPCVHRRVSECRIDRSACGPAVIVWEFRLHRVFLAE